MPSEGLYHFPLLPGPWKSFSRLKFLKKKNQSSYSQKPVVVYVMGIDLSLLTSHGFYVDLNSSQNMRRHGAATYGPNNEVVDNFERDGLRHHLVAMMSSP